MFSFYQNNDIAALRQLFIAKHGLTAENFERFEQVGIELRATGRNVLQGEKVVPSKNVPSNCYPTNGLGTPGV
jgi:hypothetical protein